MENEENKSKWDSLARELGADVPPHAEPPARPAAPPPARTESKRSSRDKASPTQPPARPKPTGKDWENLAVDLGIQPPPAPRADAPTTETETTRMREDEPPSHSRAPDAVDEPPAPAQLKGSAPPTPVAAADKAPPATGGVSLWHKIFGSPDQQAQRIVESSRPTEERGGREESRRRDERPAGRKGRPPDTRPEATADEVTGTDEVADTDDAGTWREPSAEVPSEGSSAEVREQFPSDDREPRKRRGRRRRRGRGRTDEGGERDAAAPRRDEPRASRPERKPTPRPHDPSDPDIDFDDDFESLDADLDAGDDDDSDSDSEAAGGTAARGTSPRHRSIPSWEEAIGMIVETNMQARSERRRSSPQRPGRSGAPRGRSRGRRNKKP